MDKPKNYLRGLILMSILIFQCVAGFPAQKMAIPVKLQIALFLKILTFDRNLKERVGSELVFAVLYQENFGTSLEVKKEFLKLVEKSSLGKIDEIPLRFVSINLEENDIKEAASRNNVDIIYVTPLDQMKMETITSVSRSRGITTLTGVADYVKSGLAVGIDTKDEKPLILINLSAAKAEGADFSSQLLKLAKIIK